MAPVLDQFIRSLRECRLISPEEATSLEKALRASKTPHSVEDVAKLLVQSGKLTQFQAATISQGRPQSLILGEYILLDILGKGGMGVVFRARHRLMDRVVALKTLPIVSIKPDSIQRFYREVKAAARLSHPNIVTAYDAGEHAGTHYLVMEYVVGRDLSAIVKENGPLPLRQAIDYMQQTARGLEYAHKQGVVHRDVKPSTLLLDREGVVKILDMGLARLNENLVGAPEARELTGVGQILGTVDYMSPEQAENVRAANHLSDIYSLGCTLFYLLTRCPVYDGENIVQRILAHRDKPIPSLLSRRPDCPAALDAAVQRMLAKRPENRPQSMTEIIEDLQNCLANPTAAPPPARQLPGRSPPTSQSWLEDLVSQETPPATEDSQVQETTHGSQADDVLHSMPLSASLGGSTARHSKITRRLGTEKSKPTVLSGDGWKIVAALLAAGLLAVATLAVLIFRHFGSGQATARSDSAVEPLKSVVAPAHDDAKNAAAKPVPNPPSAWEEVWSAAKGRADRLLGERSFAKAIGEYSTLADRFHDPILQQRCKDAIEQIEAKADAAYLEVEKAAREHWHQGQFAQGRTALQSALATYGPVPSASQRVQKLIEEIDQAQRSAPPPVKPATTSQESAPQAHVPDLLKQRQLDAKFNAALRGVEGRVAGWDFQRAVQQLAKVRFDAPELTARLTLRREQIQRMADLKDRMIAMINQSDPHLEKKDLALRGINGQIDKADAEAIAVTLPTGKQELHSWQELGSEAVNKMLARVVRREDAGDWLAAGLLSLADKDTPAAERYFHKAQTLGADTASYRALLAAMDFAEAQNLLGKQLYAQSETRLAALQEKYGTLPWFAANKPEWDAAAKEVKRGLRENDAKKLYAQAAALFHQGDLYELKPLLARLRTEYADSAVAADPERKPSLAELEKAVADLGPLLRVRRDGQGDTKTIQEAVNKATRKTMIQIEEVGPWTELIVVPIGTEGLTICGKKGLLPIITTAGAPNGYSENFMVHAADLSLERLQIVRDDAGGTVGTAITAEKTSLSVREAVVHGHLHLGKLDARQGVFTAGVHVQGDVDAKDCAFFGQADFKSSCAFQNVLVAGNVDCGSESRLRHCTIKGQLQLSGIAGTVSDSILSAISAEDNQTIDHCDVYGDNPYRKKAVAGKKCFAAPPQFFDAKDVDFKLQPGSPCRRAASDGNDMGFVPTAEIQPLLKAAAALRNRGKL